MMFRMRALFPLPTGEAVETKGQPRVVPNSKGAVAIHLHKIVCSLQSALRKRAGEITGNAP